MTAKLLVLYNPPTDPSAFAAYYTDHHLPLVKAVPGLQSATSSVGPIGTPAGPSSFHQVSIYTWQSIAELQDGLRSTAGAAAADDLPKFATNGATLLIFEDENV